MGGSVITVAQQKGGSGKTTLSANLAVGLRRLGQTVALIDTDPQGSLGRWFMTRIDQQPEAIEGFEFATSSAWGITYECRKLADRFDVVIVDTPPKADSDLRPALRAADLVLVPVSMSHLDLWATESVLDLARRENREVLMVMNRTRPGTRLSGEISGAAQKMQARIAAAQLANRVGYAEAFGHGLSAAEGRKTPAREEVDALSSEVAQLLASG
ncbi:MAG: cobyrinic acid a,c-diamide synthase [Rhodobacteraceae bacterium]|jgi:chromosome partitioning protein|uniref:Chromosome partitioning protein n=1 Tax=Salipiger profundus TaxID=1229727 RepID=A0A1U7D2B4_9RHOB|nr:MULTISPECIES: ParA family partition ATPase [Salipiger]APX22216.1 chromosome partitioning protein [Salipiger profundus]MAB05228.1 cobyrinic acid a,c-diamide synthase [Paracoccaceae bacterium]GGA08306.1 cobyrinic acid a,c-diamide synthase [Salipiger profundus]